MFVIDKATLNLMAVVRNGEERRVITPHSGAFSWPLAVGKQWRASFRFEDRVMGRSWDPVENTWEVEAFEEVTVPAGTFKAFRLRSTPGRNEAVRSTLWYAPDVKSVVRRVEEYLPGYYRGPGTLHYELVEYRPPSATSARVAVSPAPSGPAVAPLQPVAGMRKVTYRVKGTAEEVMLTYRNAQGATEQTTVRLPIDTAWSLSFEASRGRFLYVGVQNARNTGSISCEIWVDGAMLAQVAGTGAYATVSCSDAAE